MRSFIARLAGGAIALTVGLTLVPLSAKAQVAGLSTSGVYVVDLSNSGNNLNSCGIFSTPASSTSQTTGAIPNCGPVLGGGASASSSSSNALRSASALGTANQTGTQGQVKAYGQSNSTQYSELAVAGMPSATDNLVFRFLTSQTETGDVNSNSGFGFWSLTLASGLNNPVFAQQTAGGSLLTSGATQTAQGFDFTVPFTATAGLFKYNFTVDAQGYITGLASGNTTQSGSIWAMLAGIDDVDATGAVISSASFDTQGFGAINAAPTAGPPSTVPEPSSMALVGTGLLAFAPAMRKRFRR